MSRDREFDDFLRELKRLVDERVGGKYFAHGPLRVRFGTFTDDKRKVRHYVDVEADGRRITVHASPTGKVLHVDDSREKSP